MFTLYGEQTTDPVRLQARFSEKDEIRYAIWQLEKCPSTGRLHIQGYLEFKRGVRYRAVQRAVGEENAHVEVRSKSREACKVYCSKPETRISGPYEVRYLYKVLIMRTLKRR